MEISDFTPNIALRDAVYWYHKHPNDVEYQRNFYRSLRHGSLLVGTAVDASLGADRCTQTAYDINLLVIESAKDGRSLIGFTDLNAFKHESHPGYLASPMTCLEVIQLVLAYGYDNLLLSLGKDYLAVPKSNLQTVLKQ